MSLKAKSVKVKKTNRRVESQRRGLLFFEKSLLADGRTRIGGVDEVGRGCLAGPVCAAAVILPPGLVLPEVTDSKLLSPSCRERLYEDICRKALAWAVSFVDSEEIDRINIHRASLRAMQLAALQLNPPPDFLLVDGRFPIPAPLLQKPIIKGDRRSQTVAAASILAKVSRDRWMAEEAKKYPVFNFRRHKGYGTAEHFAEIKRYGLTPLHRRSFTSFKIP